MKTLCVFCGSSLGSQGIYREQAELFGRILAENGIRLIYGGGNVGIMGVLADSVLKSGGEVTGVMPKNIVELRIAHEGLTEMLVVDDMHQRKMTMAGLSDAFVALPGGLGTLDELTEILTFNQLRISDKPIGIFNINGYFDPLLAFLDHAVEEKFIREEHRRNMIVDDDPAQLFEKLKAYQPLQIHHWIEDLKRENSLDNL